MEPKYQESVIAEINKHDSSSIISEISHLLNRKHNIIGIQNISNNYLFNKLNTTFNFIKITQDPTKNFRLALLSLVNTLQVSGYFSLINLTYNTYKNNVIFHLNLEVNPILDEMEFLEIQNLLIPTSIINTYSQELVGYPKSLTQLNLLANQIKHWYSSRGYKWIHIYIQNNTKKSNKIYIKIIENILTKVTYKVCPLVQHKINPGTFLHNFIPIKFCNEILAPYLKIGSVPNLHAIENAMRILKSTHFFYNSYYDINFTRDKSTLEIIIHFIPYRDNNINLSIDKSIIKLDAINLSEKRFENLINKFIDKSTNKNPNIISLNDPTYPFCLFNQYIYSQDSKIFPKELFLHSLPKSYLWDDNLGVDENHEFHRQHCKIDCDYNLRYLGKDYAYCYFNYSEKDFVAQYNFSYDNAILLKKKTSVPSTVYLFNLLTSIDFQDTLYKLKKQIYQKYIVLNNIEIKRDGVELYWKRKFNNGIDFTSTLGNRKITYTHLNLKRSLSSFYFLKDQFPSLLISKINARKNFRFNLAKELYRTITQHFNIYNISFQLPFVDNIYHPTNGNFTQIDFMQFSPNSNIRENYAFLGKTLTNTLYFFKHITYLRTRPIYSNLGYHMFLFKVFLGKINSNEIAFCLSDRIKYQRYILEYSQLPQFYKLSTYFYEFLTEYHCRLFTYSNPIVFIKILKDSPLLEEYPFPHIQGELFYSNRLNLSTISTGKYLGIGWEFRTIIAKIPPIRLEFIHSFHGKNTLSLRVIPYLY
uniref:hypothetical protein n=1 Tax=Chroothece richteriana TaxID=101928 RepID=UPI001FCDFA2B|nr:hypothetical protein MW631_pgp010 [Chroothece richteriana]UNJ14298.1 hypothetical protein [Chroothece richteriana]